MKFLRRLGPDPHENGKQTPALDGCPDMWELADGDIAVIGIDITEECRGHLPATAGCGPDERIVRLPRNIILASKSDLVSLC